MREHPWGYSCDNKSNPFYFCGSEIVALSKCEAHLHFAVPQNQQSSFGFHLLMT